MHLPSETSWPCRQTGSKARARLGSISPDRQVGLLARVGVGGCLPGLQHMKQAERCTALSLS